GPGNCVPARKGRKKVIFLPRLVILHGRARPWRIRDKGIPRRAPQLWLALNREATPHRIAEEYAPQWPEGSHSLRREFFPCAADSAIERSEEHTSELQSRSDLV